LHIQLLEGSKDLTTKAIHAIGKSATPEILNKILCRVNENQKSVFDALHIAGEKSIPIIHKNLTAESFPLHYKEGLITLLGKIGGAKAHVTLIALLAEQPVYTAAIAKALHRSRYKCNPETQIKIEGICNEYLVHGIELLHMQKYLQPDKEQFSLLINALNLEILEIRNVLLSLFGCLYDHENIFKIKQGLDMKKKESVANAMEVIEVTVKKDLASKFNILFEPTDIEHRCSSLKIFLPTEPMKHTDEILNRILEEKPIHFMSWTKAYSLYVSKVNGIKIKPELIEKFILSGNLLLKETAQFVK
jgi:ATP:ADP antiporter, AAA family